jgi:hypothetical protein
MPSDLNQVLRLRLLLHHLRKLDHATVLRCSACRNTLAAIGAVFAVDSAEGSDRCVVHHINPHGAAHAVVTTRALLGPSPPVVFVGRSVARDSWFPGYAWTSAWRLCFWGVL